MNKKYDGYLYFIIGIIWLIAGIINTLISINPFSNKTSFGITYICIALVYICLAIVYISLGINKRK